MPSTALAILPKIESFGIGRTGAARAMQNHSREKHGAGSVLPPIPKNCGVMKRR
jgi:hypothetical protein